MKFYFFKNENKASKNETEIDDNHNDNKSKV